MEINHNHYEQNIEIPIPINYIEALVLLCMNISEYKTLVKEYSDNGYWNEDTGIIHDSWVFNFIECVANLFGKIFSKSQFKFDFDRSVKITKKLNRKIIEIQSLIVRIFVHFKVDKIGCYSKRELMNALYIGEAKSHKYNGKGEIVVTTYKPTSWSDIPDVHEKDIAKIEFVINEIMWEAKLEKEKDKESSNADNGNQKNLPQWATASEIAVYLGLDKTDKPLRTALSRVYGKSSVKNSMRQEVTDPRRVEDKYRWNTLAKNISDVIVRFQKKTE